MAHPTRFESLALPLMPAAYNHAFWILRSREDAEDAVQEAYLRAFRAFDDLRNEDIRPWFLTIVRNVAFRTIGTRRRSGNVISLDAGSVTIDVADPAPLAEAGLIQQGTHAQLHAALAELPAIHREIISLRDIEGLSYREISQIMGIAIGTVMSRLARGRQELRKKLVPAGAKDGTNDH
jgi:RNA polymerase sigma-70 factor, ECF subfamily